MTLTPPNFLKILFAPLVVFAAVLAVLTAVNGAGSPSLPVSADPGGPTGDSVRDFQRAVRAAPASAPAYAGLGEAYLARARETGDPGFYSRADRSFAAALRRDPGDLGALIGAATLSGLRHDFGEQLRLARLAVAQAPQLARPYTVLADAQIELGRYDSAARSIQRLVDAKPGLASYSRASYYRELSGDTAGAVEAMRLAASAGGTPENVAYVQVLLGDLQLQRGRVGAARLAYTASLRALPGYPAGMVGLARADAAGGALGGAAARLRRAAGRLPLTSTLALQAQVERALGNDAAADAALAAARAQQRLYAAAATAPDAEAVLFEADFGSPRRAVALGRRVWRSAPSVRSADALGWALARSGRPDEGLRWARRALRLGSLDPGFRFHAGMTAIASGRPTEGRRHLELALRHGLTAFPWQAARAKEALR
jgi:tetratricopeptide (TPR) repeat protein